MQSSATKLGFIVISILAAVGLARGTAHADAQPGSADTNSTSTVQVSQPADSNAQITVTNTSSSTTTVGTSSDGQTSTPSVTQTGGTPGPSSPTTALVSDPSKGTVQNAEQSNQSASLSQNDASVGGGAGPSQDGSLPAATQISQIQQSVIHQALVRTHAAKTSAPVAPAQENKGLPTPATSTSGSVSPVMPVAPGSTGKGMAAKFAGLSGTIPGSAVLATLTLLLLIVSSFMSYLRRSRFQHAPRSDASPAALNFATPPSKLSWVLATSPVPSSVLVMSDTKQLIGRKGGE